MLQERMEAVVFRCRMGVGGHLGMMKKAENIRGIGIEPATF
jgi:hypothetical protein